MENEPIAAPGGDPPVWKIWANPIVRRYARSRLRARGLGIWLLITLLGSGFIFFVSRQIGIFRGDIELVDAERLPLIPLLFFQGFILFLMATGQVASGMTAERDEGVGDYQRLAPMTPLAKVLGYLFGLPIREYVMFLTTMPFTLWGLCRGEVPLGVGLQIYGVFLISAVLYHVTGLLAGTVVKNRRWAFLISSGLVFVLYTIVPQAAKFGLACFEYLTIYPVVQEALPSLVPRDIGATIESARNSFPMARFFDIDLPQAAFAAVSQGVFIFIFFVMLSRHWSRAESHLLGKAGAVGVFTWIQLVLIGNALPLIAPGTLFPFQGFNLGQDTDWEPHPLEAIIVTGAFGMVTLALLWTMITLITPTVDGQVRGWRRARKLGSKSLSPFSDPATSFPWVAIMVMLGTGGWFCFSKSILESHWFSGREMPLTALPAFALVLASGGFGFQAGLERQGRRAVGLAVILVGILPVMIGIVLAATSNHLAIPAIWLAGISPVMGPIYAAGTTLPIGEMANDFARAVPRAFWFWQTVAGLIALNLILKLRRSRVAMAKETARQLEEPRSPRS